MNRRLRVVEDIPLSASQSDQSGDGAAVPGTHPAAGQETRTPMDLDHGSPVTRAEAPATARMVRSRWKIENETFMPR